MTVLEATSVQQLGRTEESGLRYGESGQQVDAQQIEFGGE
jgi:hypothetical protein